MTERISVLHVFNAADVIGGGEESQLELIRALPPPVRAVLAVPGDGEVAARARAMERPVDIVPLPTLRALPGPPHLRALGALGRAIARHAVDVVHANGSRAMLYAGVAARRARVPVVWHVRVVDRDPWLDPLLRRLATVIVANSGATATRFERRDGGATNVRVVPNGVDVSRFHPGPEAPGVRADLGVPDRGPIVGYFGRIEHGKGPDLLLAAAPEVCRSVPGAHFLFVGDGPLGETLARGATAAGLSVVVASRRPEVLPAMRACAVVVVPSRQEGFGRVVIEAMAAGVPVVATRVGGLPEVLMHDRTGLVVDPESPEALATAIVATLRDPEATGQRVRAAAADVRARFSLEAHALRVAELYRALLVSRRPR